MVACKWRLVLNSCTEAIEESPALRLLSWNHSGRRADINDDDACDEHSQRVLKFDCIAEIEEGIE